MTCQPLRRILRRIAFFSFAAASLVFVAIVSFYFPSASGAAHDVVVPDLIGSTYLPNDPRLPADLYALTVDYRTDDTCAPGTVLSQTPAPNAVRRTIAGEQRCALHLTVSAGTPQITLPDLVGTQASLAALRLTELGLHVNQRQQITDRFSVGQVLQTDPAAGSTLCVGDTVTLTVSTVKTQRTLTVPQLVDAPKEVALAALKRAGMTLKQIIYAPSDKPRDTVITQFPLGNTLVTALSAAATLTLSDGSLYQAAQEMPDAGLNGDPAADQEFRNEAESDTAPMPSPNATQPPSHESEH